MERKPVDACSRSSQKASHLFRNSANCESRARIHRDRVVTKLEGEMSIVARGIDHNTIHICRQINAPQDTPDTSGAYSHTVSG